MDPLGGRNVGTLVFETGRPARVELCRLHGALRPVPSQGLGSARRSGRRSSSRGACGAAWSLRHSLEQLLPPDTEARLASFTELVATAIANAESRAALARLAEEQAALRRVATLVARGTAPEKVFAAVTEEVARLLPVDSVGMGRYEPDGTFTYVASWGGAVDVPSSRQPVDRRGAEHRHARVRNRPSGPDRRAMPKPSGPLSTVVRETGIRSAVGAPIIVEGRLWGLIGVASTLEQPLPPDTEARLVSFTELVATAIANAREPRRADGLPRADRRRRG